MAVDSIIARPTNSVRVIVAEASGCCASAVRAEATDRPSPSAGAMLPTLVVKPAVAIEATAIIVMLSIVGPLMISLFLFQVAGAGSGLGLRVQIGRASCRERV